MSCEPRHRVIPAQPDYTLVTWYHRPSVPGPFVERETIIAWRIVVNPDDTCVRPVTIGSKQETRDTYAIVKPNGSVTARLGTVERQFPDYQSLYRFIEDRGDQQ